MLRGFLKFLWNSKFRKEYPMLKTGQPAPEFEARDQDGNLRRLEDFRGRNVVLWFFPKADTPG